MWRAIGIFLGVLAVILTVFAGLQFRAERQVGTGPVTTGPAPGMPARPIAFVANAVGGTVSLVALDENRVIGEIDVTPDGKKVGFFRDPIQSVIGQPLIERSGLNYAQDTDVSPDGRVLYVSRGHLGDVAAFDIATGALMWRVSISGVRADHMAISPDGYQLYVAALTDNIVEIIDTRTGRITGSFRTGAFPHDIHISKDGKRIYNASLGDMTEPVERRDNVERATDKKGFAYQLTVADAESLSILKRYRFPGGIRPFATSRDESKLYAQLSNEHAVYEYDLIRGKMVQRLSLPVKPGVTVDDYDFEAPHHGLQLSGDGKIICLAGRASDYVGFVSTENPLLDLSGTVDVGDAPSWAANGPDGLNCLVANNRSDDLSIVSYCERKELARVKVGRAPKHISVAAVPLTVLEGYIGAPAVQSPPVADVINSSDGGLLPINRPSPEFPVCARERGTEGFVMVEFTITPDGTVRDGVAVATSNKVFVPPVLRAVKAWTYQPFERDGKAIAVRTRVTIEFRLKDADEAVITFR